MMIKKITVSRGVRKNYFGIADAETKQDKKSFIGHIELIALGQALGRPRNFTI